MITAIIVTSPQYSISAPNTFIIMYTTREELPLSGALSESIEILLPGNCRQVSANKLTKSLYRFECSLR